MRDLIRRLEEGKRPEQYLTTQPRGWGVRDGLRFKKDQAAWREAQTDLVRKAQRIVTRALQDAEPGDEEVFAQQDEASATGLAELAAHELDHDEWLDDETHWIWDVAMDVASDWNREHGWE